MSTPDAEEQGRTAPIDLPAEPTSSPPAAPEPIATPAPDDGRTTDTVPAAQVVATPVPAPAPDIVYVPMAVSIGDGFKFGCGFFLALVLAMLVGFVLLAALFALTTLFGLNLPITR